VSQTRLEKPLFYHAQKHQLEPPALH